MHDARKANYRIKKNHNRQMFEYVEMQIDILLSKTQIFWHLCKIGEILIANLINRDFSMIIISFL